MTMKINAKSINGTMYAISIDKNITVGVCKKIIADEYVKKPVNIIMVFLGKVLEETKKLSEYGIGDGSTVIIVEREKDKLSTQSTPTPAPMVVPAPAPPVPYHAEQDDDIPPLEESEFDVVDDQIRALALTIEDLEHIEQLVTMGFDRTDSIQTYMACERDINRAIDILSSN